MSIASYLAGLLDSSGQVKSTALGNVAGNPAGVVVPYAGSSAPTGWLLCGGQAVSRATYATLFTAISTTYGAGDGSTTFNLPDLRGRAPHGVDNMGGTAANRVTVGASGITGTTLGSAGGTETHTLTTAQVAAHTHSYGTIKVTGNGYAASNPCEAGFGTATSGSTGGGGAHQNMPPTIMLNYIIKT